MTSGAPAILERVSEDTRRRIIEATLTTLRTDGAAGASARTIAATGGFSTSLLFYHFGSVEGALLAAAEHDTAARVARYTEELDRVEDLAELVAFARRMHTENLEQGHVTVLVQMLAATSSHPGIRGDLARAFDPWIDLVRRTLDRLLGPDGVPGVADTQDLAVGITSLFLGLELLTHLGDDGRAPRVLDALDGATELVVALTALTGGPEAVARQVAAAASGARDRHDPLEDLPGGSSGADSPAGTPPPP